ncbi:DUF3857 domain-containing protein [Flavobacterium sp.]|uniref:DUF3857 domain-containing protein n=1 Tax=Flavobacterium sp. TaxID=239 RepID=UPI002FDB6D47
MNKKKAFLLIVLFQLTNNFAQDLKFKNFDFSNETIEIPKIFENENEVILQKDIKIEFIATKNSASQYFLLHEKVWINSDDAIERNNRVYIPFRTDEKVITNKLRVILKNGKIIELNNKDIKEEVDEERGIKYNYYAVNGLEKGAIIEKLFLLEEIPELKGKTIKLQDEYPIVKASFELIFPEHLLFKYKSYNGLPEATFTESVVEGKSNVYLEANAIPGLPDDEKYANWDAKIMMFRYQLDANKISGARNLFNYKEFANAVYENLYIELDKKNQKSIDDFCKTITKTSKTADQIWNIENKIKKTIAYNRYFDGNKTLSDVLKTKQANELDLIRFYIAVFKHFNIETQTVFTTKRFTQIFDKDFETTEHLKNILLYFPEANQYLEPESIEYRTPLFNFNYGENYGLFIKEKEFGGAKMGIGELNFIQIPSAEITHDIMNITVDFTKDINNPLIHTNIQYGGYSALNFQTIKDFVPEDRYKEILKDISKNYTSESDYKTLKTENDGTDFVGKKPFVLDLTFEGKDLIQKAGDNILFKIGETIGKQMEFYQEDKRVLPIEIYYPHYYTRVIKIILPDNYTIKNLSDFNMNKSTDVDGKKVALFESSFQQKEREITVNNIEYYQIIHYPLNVFESYKEVINAAADFNKITIILTKK